MRKIKDIDDNLKQEMISKNYWNENCPVHIDRLKILHIDYIDFEGHEHHDGQMMVFDVVAENVLQIFTELKTKKFPIAKIKLISEYDADDEKSMADNNSSAFCCRFIKDSDKYSIHSYGMAIDINPLQNPVIYTDQKPEIIMPKAGAAYTNRSNIRPGMITSDVVDLFKKYGFEIWGGNWQSPIDYHHFNLPKPLAEKLASTNYEAGIKLI